MKKKPLFVIAFKDEVLEDKKEIVKKHIAIEILLNMLIGKSSKLYKNLYEKGLLFSEPDLDYEFSKQYAHIVISGQSRKPEEIPGLLEKELEQLKTNGINEQDFERIKKKIYGDYVKEYNDPADIARMFMGDYFKGINSFEYIEQHESVTIQYAQEILKQVFNKDKMVVSIVKGNKED